VSKITNDASHYSQFLTSYSSLASALILWVVPFWELEQDYLLLARSLVTCHLGLSVLVFGWDCIVATGLTFWFINTSLQLVYGLIVTLLYSLLLILAKQHCDRIAGAWR
jgi:hypothetical protein